MTEFDRQPPWAEFAEQATLGGMMLSFTARAEALTAVESRDFYLPKHQSVFEAINGLHTAGEPADAVTVSSALERTGDLRKVGGAPYLLTLIQSVPTAANAEYYAQIVSQKAVMRRLIEAGTRIVQYGYSDAEDASEVVSRAQAELRAVQPDYQVDEPKPLSEFLAVDDSHDWLVPGLLERLDRLVLTGGEGGGKSWMVAQMATCMAAGVHPFTAAPLGSGLHNIRVLVVDCENSPSQSRRRFRRMVNAVDTARYRRGLSPVDWSDSLFIDIRPAGIDLMSSRDVAWLEHTISAVQADLLCLGPLYKLHHLDPSDEKAAREIAWVLDGLRERHGFALVTEAHAGNGSDSSGDRMMRPIGSSLFRRWPEFGFGLRRSRTEGPQNVFDVVAWRGAREERDWPEQLVRGTGELPWSPVGGDAYGRLGVVS